MYIPGACTSEFQIGEDGIFSVFASKADAAAAKNPQFTPPSIQKFYQDQDYITTVVSDGPTKSFAYRRLRFLESKFQMYKLLNEYQEMAESKVYLTN
jgi:AMP deaminase